MLREINTEEFNSLVYNLKDAKDDTLPDFLGKNPAVIDFYATWCGPCRVLEETIKIVEKDYEGKVDFYKVNIENDQELAVQFGVMSVPTMLFIPTKGKPEGAPGAPSKDQLKYYVDGLLEKSK